MNRKEMADLAKDRRRKRTTGTGQKQIRRTGGQVLKLLLEEDAPENKGPKAVPQIILYLREGLNPAESNFTKYPNQLHTIMNDLLSEQSEGLLYIYLWRQSWGYGRNYCRSSYGAISKDSLVGARRTAQRAMSSLAEKKFVVRALQKDGAADVTQNGHLYRVITPAELINGKTEEGVDLDDIPSEGVVMMTMATTTTPVSADKQRDSGSMDTVTIRHDDYSGVDTMTIDTTTTPEPNPDTSMAGAKCGHDDYSNRDVPFKEDSFKDSLSPDLVKLFYTGIGQQRITKVKREKGDFVLLELQKEGFSPEDIQFAVEWTLMPGNTKEQVHDFSIIPHTIGQALTARDAEEIAAESARKEAARAEATEEERRLLEGEIQEMRSKMAQDELVELREEALEAIRNTEGVKEQFITDMLIVAKENELLGR